MPSVPLSSGSQTTPRQLDVAIASVAVAAPALRLPLAEVNAAWGRKGGRGQVAVCRSDEDTLTLAATAGLRALEAAGAGPDDVGGLWWGTARAPFAEGPSWATLAATLRLGGTVDGALSTGSSHAGVDALLAAADAIAAGRVDSALVVTSDALRPALGSGHETAAGAGAAAVVLRRGSGPARLDSVTSRWEPLLDRYRGDEESETREAYDGRLFREEVYLPLGAAVTEALGANAGSRWSIADPDGRLGSALARRIRTDTVASADSRAALGDLGAAASLVGIAAALGEVGPAAVFAYGGGRATALSIQVDAPVPGAELVAGHLAGGLGTTYAATLRARRQLSPTGESVEMAVPPGSAMFVRDQREVLGLIGARCVECGTVNVPPSVHPSCPGCAGDKFDLVTLARSGTVQTYVVNHTMPAPFEAPLPLVVVDLDDGTRVQLQGADDGSALEIGGRVELVPRRYTIERGVPVYGWKVLSTTPTTVGSGEGSAQ